MQPGVKITASAKQKDEIILEGNDIELVSRSGTNINYNTTVYIKIFPFACCLSNV